MKTLEEIQAASSFSTDQARRRVLALVRTGVLTRERVPHSRNKMGYADEAVDMLKRLEELEKLLPPKKALLQFLAERVGDTGKQDLTREQLLKLVEEKERTIVRLDQENRQLRNKIQLLRGKPPAEVGKFRERAKLAMKILLRR